MGEKEKAVESLCVESLCVAEESQNAALFSDEGDAILGRRGQICDTHDRCANRETAFPPQRLEACTGAVMLATNRAGQSHHAFLRRLRQAVEYPTAASVLRAGLRD